MTLTAESVRRRINIGLVFVTGKRWPRLFVGGLLLLLVGVLSGCSTARFYAQAIHGQSQMLHRQRSISKLLSQPDTPPALAARLDLALTIRAFAEKELGLPANGHYLTYADLGRSFAVWNVYAAPEFSFEAKSWWYPVVGRLEYQGYFGEANARRVAARLALRGYDVYVGGVQAYSTLGWFRDPVLNTFVFDNDLDLAELLFHELAHQRLFLSGDTDFNEAFATAAAEEGVRRWLSSRGDAQALVAYEDAVRRREQFVALLSQSRAELTAVYSRLGGVSPTDHGESHAAKAAAYARLRDAYAKLKESWRGGADYDHWFSEPLNNARLNTVETYFGLVPAFRQLLADCQGELPQFYREAERISRLKRTEREQCLSQLSTVAVASGRACEMRPEPARLE